MSVYAEAGAAAAPKPILKTRSNTERLVPAEVPSVAGGGGLLVPKQVARMLGISVKVLEKWRAIKKGPAVMRLTSKTLRYHVADVDAYIESNRPQA